MDITENSVNEEPIPTNNERLFTTIWLRPTETLRYILENCQEKYVIPLFVLGGIVRAIGRASMQDKGDEHSTVAILALAIFVGGAFGWITFYIYAWALSATGKWLKGNAGFEEFKTVIAWSMVPTVCSLILLIPQVVIFGDDLFKSEPVNTSMFHVIMMMLFAFLEITLGVWSIVILVKGISLLQGFNTWKAILNMILPGLVILVPLVLLALLSDPDFAYFAHFAIHS